MDCSTPGFPVHHQLPEPARYSVSGSSHSNRTSNGVTIFTTFTEKWPWFPSKATDHESDPASQVQGGVRAGDPGACLPQDLCSCPAPEKQIWSAVFGDPHSMILLSLRESVGMTKGNWSPSLPQLVNELRRRRLLFQKGGSCFETFTSFIPDSACLCWVFSRWQFS